jgi:hypothetical protein
MEGDRTSSITCDKRVDLNRFVSSVVTSVDAGTRTPAREFSKRPGASECQRDGRRICP